MNDTEALLSFFRSVAHDTKTPLNAIISSVGLLAHSPLDEDQLIDVLEIKRNSSQLRRYLETIFIYAKYSTGDFPITPYPLRLSRTFVELVEESSPERNSDDSSLSLFIGNNIADRVQADVLRVEMLLGNLLFYCFQHCKRGSRIGLLLEHCEKSDCSNQLGLCLGILSGEERSSRMEEFLLDSSGAPQSLLESIRFVALQCLCDLNGRYVRRSKDESRYADRFVFELGLPRKERKELLAESLSEELSGKFSHEVIDGFGSAYHFSGEPKAEETRAFLSRCSEIS